MGTRDARLAADTALGQLGGSARLTWRVMPPAYRRPKVRYEERTDGEGMRFIAGHPPDEKETMDWRFDGCLERFLRFQEEPRSPRGLVKFAERYGSLWPLCGHRRRTLSRFDFPYLAAHECGFCRSQSAAFDSTPVETWVTCAKAARAVLLIAGALRNGRESDPGWWRDAVWGHPSSGDTAKETAGAQWVALSNAVRAWVTRWVSIDFGIEPEPEQGGTFTPRGGLVAHAHGTLGMLALQLAATACSIEGMYECGWCGILHARRRAPKKTSSAPTLCRNCMRLRVNRRETPRRREARAALHSNRV